MKRALEIAMIFSILWLAFSPKNICAQVTSPCTDIEPPFITTGAKPNILIILDNSGSMAQTFQPGGGGPTKIAAAQSAIINVINSLDTRANFGLMTFNNSGYNDTQSGMPPGSAAGQMQMPISDVNPADPGNQYTNLMGAINGVYVSGGTPTPGVFQAALNYFNGASTPIQSQCQKNFVVLVTDGLPNTPLDASYPQPDGAEIVIDQAIYGIEELLGLSSPGNSVNVTYTGGYNNSSGNFTAWPVPTSSNISNPNSNGVGLDPVTNQYDVTKFSSWVCNGNTNCAWTNVSHTFSDGTTNPQIPIKTYCLGIGYGANGPSHELDALAMAAKTDVNGEAYNCSSSSALATTLQNVMALILSNVAAGSSVSTIATTSQSGDNMLQGVFYPAKSFASTGISWPGYLYDWWYTIQQPAPSSMVTSIREDNHGVLPGASTVTEPDYILDLQKDFILNYNFDTTQNLLGVTLFQDPNGNGAGLTQASSASYQLDSLTPLWEAGKLLWQTPPTARTIYTPNSTGTALVSFDTSNTTLNPSSSGASSPLGDPTSFDSCLDVPTSAPTPLANLINYVRGQDFPNTYCSNGTTFETPLTACSAAKPCASSTYNQCIPDPASCRNRTVGLCTDSQGNDTNIPCATTSDCTGTGGSCVSHTWKLGDIVYSTPKVQVNYTYCYDTSTNSFTNTPCTQASDCSSISSDPYSCQPAQDLVFVGANDGMLHAFQSGALSATGLTSTSTDNRVAQLTGIPTQSMGTELWAFVPANVVPYLRCLASGNGCHLYYNDLTPYITTMTVDNDYCATTDSSNNHTFTTQACTQDSDCTGTGQTCVSKGQQTKTILIGGLRLGGGAMGDYCTNSKGGSSGWACGPSGSCPSATTTTTSSYCVNSNGQTSGIPRPCSTSSDCTRNHPYTWYNICASFTGDCTNSSGQTNGTPCNSNSDCTQNNWWYNPYNQCSSASTTSGYCVDTHGATNWQTCTSSSACTTSPYNSACLPFSSCNFISNVPSDTCPSPSSWVQNDGTTTGYEPPFASTNTSPCVGLSSYYALDITNPQSPKLLWEFSNPLMGYSYSGPAVIHKWLNPTNMTGDQYDVMFLSGPTNPADGSSALPLRIFVLKLNPITLTIDSVTQKQTDTPKNYAYGGRLFTNGLSVGNDKYTDYVLFGYTTSTPNSTSSATTWGGGIGLVYTDATTTSNNITTIDAVNGVNPQNWTYDVNTFANVPNAPITSAIASEACFGKNYLFAGSGKYFYGADPDVPSSTNALNFITGMPFSCDNLFTASSCQANTLSSVNTGSACSSPDAPGVSGSSVLQNGWIYYLPDADSANLWLKERVVTDPTAFPSANITYFTSTQPTSDPCSYGGRSEEWAFNCATGGPITDTSCGAGYTANSDLSDLYLQTSTGAIYNISSTGSSGAGNSPLTFNNNGGRSTAYVVGTPPETALPLSTPPPPTSGGGGGQIMLWIEK